ncbi:MAG TPA: HAD-IIA family hydrolase [Chloroflexota bacterium]|nr:HAD-IIA family hydrolase [Chloroflexota bacterium]
MPVPRPLSGYAAYLFDVDGTLVYHDRPVPGAGDALRALKAAGKGVLAVTNNSSLARHALAERFRRFALPLDDEEVFSAMVASAQLIAYEQPGARVHVFGNAGLRAEIERVGLVATEEVEADYLVVGNHRGITYDRLTTAMRTLLNGARFIAVNVDRIYVGSDGGLVPGCGVMVAALERAVGRGPDVIVGKPSVTLLHEAARSLGQPPSACLYAGDNPEADVAGAHAAGMDALLVLTGVASTADGAAEQAEHVLASVADLTAIFEPPSDSAADVTLRRT